MSQTSPSTTLAKRWNVIRRSKLAAVLIAFALGFVGLGGWALSSPVGSEPDSDFHLASIWCTTADPGSPCDMEERRNRKMVPSALVEARCYSQDQNASAACQPLMTTADGRETMTNRLNIVESQAGYPSGFYLFHNQLAGENVDTSVVTMRMVNITIFLALGSLLWWLLPLRLRESFIWGWAGTVVPLGLFVIASTNPSSWALIGAGSAWIALLGYLEAHGWQKWGLGILFLLYAGLAAASRTDATLFVMATSAVAIFATDSSLRQVIRRLWIPAVGAVGALALLALRSGALDILFEGFMRGRETVDWERIWYNFIETPGLWLGAFGGWPWGSLGWLDTPLPHLVEFLTISVFVFLLARGFSRASWRVRVVGLTVLAMLWFYPLFILQQADVLVGVMFQSRYVLPLLPVFLGLLVLRNAHQSPPISLRSSRMWIVIAIAVANALSLHRNIRRYVTGLDGYGFNLNNGEWWWFGLYNSTLTPMTVWVLGSLAFFGFLWVVVVWGVDQVADKKAVSSDQSEALAR